MTTRDRVRLSRDLLANLALAARARVSQRGEINLPAIDHREVLDGRDLEQAVRWMDTLSKVALFWTPRRCFLRSFAMAAILRARGVPVLLHIGVADSRYQRRVGGHAWVSLGDTALAEKSDPWLRYPTELGSHCDAIFYWAASEGSGPSPRFGAPFSRPTK